MKFSSNRRANPFDNPFLAWALHVMVAGVACISGYYSLVMGTFVPLAFGAVVILAIEAVWLYFRLRR
jgi:hypothetical protein